METKVCYRCKVEKPVTAFGLQTKGVGGRNTYCRQCRSEMYFENHKVELERSRKNHQNRYKNGKATQGAKDYLKRNPEVSAARWKTQNAILRGDLVRPKKCPVCKKKTTVEAHHDDYKKPLDVRWMCKLCHRAYHRELRDRRELLTNWAAM